MFKNFIENIDKCKEIKNWKEEFNKLNKNPEQWQKYSKSLKEKEYKIWKLIIIQFHIWNKQNIETDDNKFININKFKEFQEYVENFINNFRFENKINELNKNEIKIWSDTIKTFIEDIKRSTFFLKKEKIKLINEENDMENYEKTLENLKIMNDKKMEIIRKYSNETSDKKLNKLEKEKDIIDNKIKNMNIELDNLKIKIFKNEIDKNISHQKNPPFKEINIQFSEMINEIYDIEIAEEAIAKQPSTSTTI